VDSNVEKVSEFQKEENKKQESEEFLDDLLREEFKSNKHIQVF
jgi:hypothetical protein